MNGAALSLYYNRAPSVCLFVCLSVCELGLFPVRGTPRWVGLGCRTEGWLGEMRHFLNFAPNSNSLNKGGKVFLLRMLGFCSVLRALMLE